MKTMMTPERFLSRFALALALSAVSLCAGAAKPDAPGAALAGKADAQTTAYQDVKLAELVPASRTGGERAIFEPRPVRFTARLAQLPICYDVYREALNDFPVLVSQAWTGLRNE
jgi:hypothetical protein